MDRSAEAKSRKLEEAKDWPQYVNIPSYARAWGFDTCPQSASDGMGKILAWLREDMRPRGLVLTGRSGLGKTGVLLCALQMAAQQGAGTWKRWRVVVDQHARGYGASIASPVWYARWHDILDESLPDRGKAKLADLDRDVDGVLGVDDIDAGRLDRRSEPLLIRLAERPLWEKGVILTTNKPPERWEKVFGERVATRLKDERKFFVLRFS